ncbi:MAG: hypothetical protein IKK50_05370 [Ruminiclostridium sp.]|nr:hypothetical protein [Ruminiclostridium sp.]
MKRVLSLCLALMMTLSLCACGGGESASDAQEETMDGLWEAIYETDEFGDVAENAEIVLRSPIVGDFSNTATNSSELGGYVFIDAFPGADHYYVVFRLQEYGDMPITYTSSEAEEIVLKTKVGDKISEYSLLGVAPNSDLVLGTDNVTDGDEVYASLCNGNDVRCIITIGSSQYNFTIYSSNILVAGDEASGLAQAQIDARQINSTSEALKAFFEKRSYTERGNYLIEHMNDYPVVETDELKELFPGLWMYMEVDSSEYTTWWVNYYESDSSITPVGYFVDGDEWTEPSNTGLPQSYEVIDNLLREYRINGNERKLSKEIEFRKLQDGYYIVHTKHFGYEFESMEIYVQYTDEGNPAYEIQ